MTHKKKNMKLLNLCGKLLFVTESSNDDDENVSL